MIKIIYGIIIIMISLSLINTYIEYDSYKRQFSTFKKDYLDSSYQTKYKSIEGVLENRINSYEFIYLSYKQKLYWDSSIVVLVLLVIYLKKRLVTAHYKK